MNIRQLLETALNAIVPAIDTAWENIAYAPVDGRPYQQVNLLFATNQNPSFKSGSTTLTRYIGIFQVMLQYPAGTGAKDADARAQLIKSAFPYGQSFTSGAVTVIVSGTPTIAPGRNDGDRWAIPVKVPFFANVFE